MKRSSLWLLWTVTFLAGAVSGGACMYFYVRTQARCTASCAAPRLAQADLLLAQLEQAALPDGVSDAQPAQAPQSSAQIPSQLVRSELPQDIVLGAVTEEAEPAPKETGIVLSDEQNTVVLGAQKPVARATDGSSITMIEAPVAVKRIVNLDQYKAFKTQARGSYPMADFTREEVLVLESVSNLPDNVFEIVDIVPQDQALKVYYRVNVFGLDKKTHTHSAQKIAKTSLPVVLEQVL